MADSTKTDIAGESSHPEIAEFAAGASVGRYVILGQLGAGGMGVVYAAYDPKLDRRVALKVVRPERRGLEPGALAERDPAQARLVREAQAMARLAHPNVVTVHDVGTIGDAVFIAMEFVDGQTLADWLRAAPRTTSEVLAVFREAGRGLAAAHAAGIVHRDFKPDNVLVQATGRVAVADFGLARVHDDTLTRQPASADEALDDTAVPAQLGLTRTGERMGTPTYMAPEQYLGRPTDARTDQFSYCVAFYEALYGRRPFADEDLSELSVRVTTGKVSAPPAGRRVPPRVERAVMRGLRPNPSERFASMADLLAEIEVRPLTRRPEFVGAVAAVLALGVAAGVVAGTGAGTGGKLCAGADSLRAGVWGKAKQTAIEAAFRATGHAGADETWRSVERNIEAYVVGLVAAHKDACEATRVRGEQSEEMLDLRMQCVSDLRERLSALTALFAKADAALVDKAPDAVSELPSVKACADAEGLKTGVKLPKDEATRVAVAEIRKKLADGDARFFAGKMSDAKRIALQSAGAAAKLGYRPVEAEALMLLATVLTRERILKPAEEILAKAIAAAESSRHDRVAARLWAVLVNVVGFDLGRTDEGLRLARFAEAAIARLNRHDDDLDARLANSLSSIHQARGDFGKARAFAEKALAAAERAHGGEFRRVGPYRMNLALILARSGHDDDGLRRMQEALESAEKTLGPNHPDVGDYYLTNVAWFYYQGGRCAEALPIAERAYRIARRAFGDLPGTRQVAHTYGEILRCTGRPREALPLFEKAKVFFENVEGGKGRNFALVLLSLAGAHLDLGEVEKAHAASERALQVLAETPGDAHLGADAKFLHAVILKRMKGTEERAAGLVREARETYVQLGARGERARRELESTFGAAKPVLGGGVDAGVRR